MGVDNILEINKWYPKLIIVLSHLDDSVRKYIETQKINIKNIIIPDDGDIIIDTK